MTHHTHIHKALCAPVTVQKDGSLQGEFVFSPDFPFFEGHFPDDPVLPGIVQIMAASLVASHKENIVLAKITRCKFIDIVRPEELVTVLVHRSHTNGVVIAKATLRTNRAPCASCTLEFATAGTARGTS